MADHTVTDRQRAILEYIEITMRERGYPPAVREIGAAVGLSSPSTVHSHLAQLESAGYLRRDPTKPRAIEVCFDASSGAIAERRPTRHVPLVGEVAAGTDVLAQENVEELVPVPEEEGPISRGSFTASPQPGRIPTRAWVSRKRASVEATITSQASAISKPAVTA